jgi:hypothetical protein
MHPHYNSTPDPNSRIVDSVFLPDRFRVTTSLERRRCRHVEGWSRTVARDAVATEEHNAWGEPAVAHDKAIGWADVGFLQQYDKLEEGTTGSCDVRASSATPAWGAAVWCPCSSCSNFLLLHAGWILIYRCDSVETWPRSGIKSASSVHPTGAGGTPSYAGHGSEQITEGTHPPVAKGPTQSHQRDPIVSIIDVYSFFLTNRFKR